MLSDDGSGKCDAYYTGNEDDVVYGVAYEIDDGEKPLLDLAESLGECYELKTVSLQVEIPTDYFIQNYQQDQFYASMYYGIRLSTGLIPYDWYLKHVVTGAVENQLPAAYIVKLQEIKSESDQDSSRAEEQFMVHQ